MPATTPAGPMRHDETVITVAGSPVRAYRAGAGPALVLLHGGGLDDAQLSWAPVWPALTGHARLLAPDLPGYGGSPLGHTAPTLEGYRTWLLAFLDAAGIQTAVVAGLSLGGEIALRTALDAPARIGGLVLLAPYGVSPRLPGGKIGYLAVHAPHAAAAQAALRHSDRLLRARLRALLHRPGAVTGELTGQVRALLAPPTPGPPGRPSSATRCCGPGPVPTSPGSSPASAARRCCCRASTTGSSHPATCAPRPPASPAPASRWSRAPATGCPATPPGRSPAS